MLIFSRMYEYVSNTCITFKNIYLPMYNPKLKTSSEKFTVMWKFDDSSATERQFYESRYHNFSSHSPTSSIVTVSQDIYVTKWGYSNKEKI